MEPAELEAAETLYSTSFAPDPRRALDVLAFVLTPAEAFAQGDEDELAAVTELLDMAKTEAVKRWYALRNDKIQN